MEQMTSGKNLKEIPVTVYTPESELRSPGRLARRMWRDLMASRELAWRLMVRDISARYRQAFLGASWAFLPPLATALLFIILHREGVINVSATQLPYPAFVIIGTVLWQLFTDSLNAPLKLVAANKSMLAKVNFPREALILSAMGEVVFDFGVRLIIVAGVFIFFKVPLTWGILLSLPAVLMLMLLGIMIGLLLTPVGVLYTDVSAALPLITNLWLFLTPVVYPPPPEGLLAWLFHVNPVSSLLVAARNLATGGAFLEIVPFITVSGLTLLGLLIMWVLYRLSFPILVERISS
jgi:lipopolysaccharide transport system permease protein